MPDDVTARLGQIKARCGRWEVLWAASLDMRDLREEESDSEFIAHAREDLPWCIAQIERLQQENERLKAEVVGLKAGLTVNEFRL